MVARRLRWTTSSSATRSTASTGGISHADRTRLGPASTTCRATQPSGASTGTPRTSSSAPATGSARRGPPGRPCSTSRRDDRGLFLPNDMASRATARAADRPRGDHGNADEARAQRGEHDARRGPGGAARRPPPVPAYCQSSASARVSGTAARGSRRSRRGRLRPGSPAARFVRSRSNAPPPSRTKANDGENATSAASRPPPTPAAP